jgi:hypothetical protein
LKIGLIGVVWTILWFLYIVETPADHKYISTQEKIHIESSLKKNDIKTIPWMAILKSVPFWAIVAAHFAETWGFYTMLTKMPTFLSDVLKYKIDKVRKSPHYTQYLLLLTGFCSYKKAGLVSSLPYLIMTLILYMSAFISDKLLERNMSCKLVRKLFCCIGFFIQFAFMLAIVFSSNAFLVILCICLAIGFGGMVWASFVVNMLDIGGGVRYKPSKN